MNKRDIVEMLRLRDTGNWYKLQCEAADEIEALREALEEIAKRADSTEWLDVDCGAAHSMAQIARRALSQHVGGEAKVAPPNAWHFHPDNYL